MERSRLPLEFRTLRGNPKQLNSNVRDEQAPGCAQGGVSMFISSTVIGPWLFGLLGLAGGLLVITRKGKTTAPATTTADRRRQRA
jgi:hypothetical protein